MIDKDKYYNANKAFKASQEAKEEIADRAFEDSVKKYEQQFNQIISLIKEAVKHGDTNLTYLPRSEADYLGYITNEKTVPDNYKLFDTAQMTVFNILRTLGYVVNISQAPVFFEGMDTEKDLPITLKVASISWNGGSN